MKNISQFREQLKIEKNWKVFDPVINETTRIQVFKVRQSYVQFLEFYTGKKISFRFAGHHRFKFENNTVKISTNWSNNWSKLTYIFEVDKK